MISSSITAASVSDSSFLLFNIVIVFNSFQLRLCLTLVTCWELKPCDKGVFVWHLDYFNPPQTQANISNLICFKIHSDSLRSLYSNTSKAALWNSDLTVKALEVKIMMGVVMIFVTIIFNRMLEDHRPLRERPPHGLSQTLRSTSTNKNWEQRQICSPRMWASPSARTHLTQQRDHMIKMEDLTN